MKVTLAKMITVLCAHPTKLELWSFVKLEDFENIPYAMPAEVGQTNPNTTATAKVAETSARDSSPKDLLIQMNSPSRANPAKPIPARELIDDILNATPYLSSKSNIDWLLVA